MTDRSQNSEIYTYESESALFALGWSVRADKPFRFAVGSFLEEHDNYVEIVQLDAERDELVANPKLRISHPYPPTKALFLPDTNTAHPDLFATASDYLRVWKIGDNEVACDRLLMNNKGNYSAPITSIDWNDQDIKRIGVASIDTTCTIWDIEKGQVDMQMITHDKEVYDIAWGGVGVFASVSADGSVRIFDIRHASAALAAALDKEHSTIVYRSPGPEVVPLLRLGWNKQDPRYLAVLGMASTQVFILDIRFPSMPVAELDRHAAAVNALAWAPNSQLHICTAGDDSRALIWDLGKLTGKALDPVLSYNAESEVTSLQWSTLHPDRVAICFGKQAQLLRV